MNGGSVYTIEARRVARTPDHHQWVYRCEHPDCDNAEHPTVARDADLPARGAARTSGSRTRSTPTSGPSTAGTMTTAQRGFWSRQANCTLIAREINNCLGTVKAQARDSRPGLGLRVERVTRIELALSAWEADVLPLNYTRTFPAGCHLLSSPRHRTGTAAPANQGQRTRTRREVRPPRLTTPRARVCRGEPGDGSPD